MKLIRVFEGDVATLGVLIFDKMPKFATLELPWRHNQKNVSCIPSGKYLCTRINDDKHGITIEVEGVPGRDGIYVHVGNTSKDTQGCILIGGAYGGNKDRPAVINSRVAMDEFRKLIIKRPTWELEIVSLKYDRYKEITYDEETITNPTSNTR